MSQEGTGLGVECRMDEPPPGLLGTGSSSSGLGPGTETRGAGRTSGLCSRPAMFSGLSVEPIGGGGNGGAGSALLVSGRVKGVAVMPEPPGTQSESGRPRSRLGIGGSGGGAGFAIDAVAPAIDVGEVGVV